MASADALRMPSFALSMANAIPSLTSRCRAGARLFHVLLAVAVAVPSLAPAPVAAQGASAGAPGFWDPRRRPERPDLGRISLIRFMTEVDYPPFDYAGPDGNPTGFNVELARALCEELHVTCTVQMRRFDTL